MYIQDSGVCKELRRILFLIFSFVYVFNSSNIWLFLLQAITEAFERELRRNKVQENIGSLGINNDEETVGKSLYCNKCNLIRSVPSTEMIFLKGKKNRALLISSLEKGFREAGFSLIYRVANLLKCGKTWYQRILAFFLPAPNCHQFLCGSVVQQLTSSLKAS